MLRLLARLHRWCHLVASLRGSCPHRALDIHDGPTHMVACDCGCVFWQQKAEG